MKNNKVLAILRYAAVCALIFSPSAKTANDTAIGEHIRGRIEDLENPLIDVLKSSSLTPTSELEQRIERAESGLKDLKEAIGADMAAEPAEAVIEAIAEPMEEEPVRAAELAPAMDEEDFDFDIDDLDDLDLPPELLKELSAMEGEMEGMDFEEMTAHLEKYFGAMDAEEEAPEPSSARPTPRLHPRPGATPDLSQSGVVYPEPDEGADLPEVEVEEPAAEEAEVAEPTEVEEPAVVEEEEEAAEPAEAEEPAEAVEEVTPDVAEDAPELEDVAGVLDEEDTGTEADEEEFETDEAPVEDVDDTEATTED